MKPVKIIALVAGASLFTFILSVFFSINMVFMKPENLAEVIKKDPYTFIEALKVASQDYQGIKKKKVLEERRKNPLKIETEGRVTFGDAKAPVTIVEFADFQCFYCSQASGRMKSLIKKYDGKVKVVYKHFPLIRHPFAKPAAGYFEAIAMMDQEKAKKFHDLIFENFEIYARLKSEGEIERKLKSLVKKTGVELKKVKDNLEEAEKVVQADLKEGERIGVGGTPSFFVNGVSARDVGVEALVEDALKEL